MLLTLLHAAIATLLLAIPAESHASGAASPDDEVVMVDKDVLIDVDEVGEQIVHLRDGDDDPLVVRVGGSRAFLGIRLMGLTEDLRKHYGAAEDSGVLVSEVEADSPAAKAGVQVGDVVTDLDGERVDSARDLSRAVRGKKAGDKVRLLVLRDRRAHELTATLDEREGRRIELGPRRHGRKAWSFSGAPDRWGKPMVLENLEDLPKLRDRLEDLEKRIKELEKRLSAR